MQKRELYHFHILNDHSDQWLIGKTLIFDKNKINNYHQKIISLKSNQLLNSDTEALASNINNISDTSKKLLDLAQKFDNNKQIELYRNNISNFSYLSEIYNRTLLYYITYIREQILEDVRLQINKELPSRKNCLWVCDENHIETWRQAWATNKNYKLFKLSLEGVFFEADGRLINNNSWCIEQFEKNAEHYWTNETFLKGNPQSEIIFEGKATIIKEY